MDDSSNSSIESSAQTPSNCLADAVQAVNSLPSHLGLLRGARLFVDMSRLSCRDPDLWRTVARCYDAGIRFDTHLKINGLFPWHHSPFSHSRCEESSFKQRRQRNASTEQTLCCLRWGVIYAPHTGTPSSLYVTKFQSLALHKDGRRFQFRKRWPTSKYQRAAFYSLASRNAKSWSQ